MEDTDHDKLRGIRDRKNLRREKLRDRCTGDMQNKSATWNTRLELQPNDKSGTQGLIITAYKQR